MEEEIWKIIPDFEKYEASNLGRIRNTKMKRIMKPTEDRLGYCRIGLTNNDSKQKFERVHRMVSETFIPNTDNAPTVDHINKKRNDNRVCNLRWATMLQQGQPENRNPPKQMGGKTRPINRIDFKTGEVLQTHESFSDAGTFIVAQGLSKSSSFKFSSIGAVCLGKQKTAFGFGWSFVQDEIEEEIWKPLPSSLIHGTEGYFISDKGRIKNKTGKIILGNCDTQQVRLSSKQYTLKRLVASVFIENPDNLPCVITCDKDMHNNCVDNLKWASAGRPPIQSNGLRSLV